MNKRSRIYANIVMAFVIGWMLIPLLATAIYSLFEDWTGIMPRGFTLSNYQKLFTNTAFLTVMYQTVLVTIIPTIITIAVVLLALFADSVYFPKL